MRITSAGLAGRSSDTDLYLIDCDLDRDGFADPTPGLDVQVDRIL